MRRIAFPLTFTAALGVVIVFGRAPAQPQPDGPFPGMVQPTAGQPPASVPLDVPLVSPAAGPWMICAASYSGPDSLELARQLAHLLNEQHRLHAYLFSRSAEERRQQEEALAREQQAHPGVQYRPRRVRIEEQWAVLVGGYGDMETASKAVKTIKQLPLPELRLASGKPAYDTYDYYSPVEGKNSPEVKRYAVNPFGNAFVIRNPTTPAPRPDAKVDPMWKALNSGEKYSLLKCPKPWTLAVKEYAGASIVQPQSAPSNFLEKIGLGGNRPGAALDASAQQAHELARLFNDVLGFKAYVLHTRTGSVVTIGAFDGPEDPAMKNMQKRLAGLSFRASGSANDILQLFPQALPMQVPHP
jgi:hypothetical protein